MTTCTSGMVQLARRRVRFHLAPRVWTQSISNGVANRRVRIHCALPCPLSLHLSCILDPDIGVLPFALDLPGLSLSNPPYVGVNPDCPHRTTHPSRHIPPPTPAPTYPPLELWQSRKNFQPPSVWRRKIDRDLPSL